MEQGNMLWKSSCLITENPTKNILKPKNGTELPTTKDNAPDKGGENDNGGILFTNNWLKAKAIEDRGTDFRKPAVRQCIEEILQPKDGTELPRTQDNTPDERGKIRPVARIFHGGGGGVGVLTQRTRTQVPKAFRGSGGTLPRKSFEI